MSTELTDAILAMDEDGDQWREHLGQARGRDGHDERPPLRLWVKRLLRLTIAVAAAVVAWPR